MIDSGNTLTTNDLVNRILQHRTEFIKRNQQKEAKELRMIQAMNSTQSSV